MMMTWPRRAFGSSLFAITTTSLRYALNHNRLHVFFLEFRSRTVVIGVSVFVCFSSIFCFHFVLDSFHME